jgi:hypothetical protein
MAVARSILSFRAASANQSCVNGSQKTFFSRLLENRLLLGLMPIGRMKQGNEGVEGWLAEMAGDW